ncbi:hypothetical protein Tco_0450908 [Tanacetum coccineum]
MDNEIQGFKRTEDKVSRKNQTFRSVTVILPKTALMVLKPITVITIWEYMDNEIQGFQRTEDKNMVDSYATNMRSLKSLAAIVDTLKLKLMILNVKQSDAGSKVARIWKIQLRVQKFDWNIQAIQEKELMIFYSGWDCRQYGNTSLGPIWIKVYRNVHMCKLQYYLGQLRSDMWCPDLMIDDLYNVMWNFSLRRVLVLSKLREWSAFWSSEIQNVN